MYWGAVFTTRRGVLEKLFLITFIRVNFEAAPEKMKRAKKNRVVCLMNKIEGRSFDVCLYHCFGENAKLRHEKN